MTTETPTPITNCKYKDWLEEYSFDTCKLNRREYGEFLSSYITGEQDGFVLNLNGSWGTGKTQFLRRLYSLLCEKGHPTIYIDAWESDFSQMPLGVVSSELISQLSHLNDDIGDDLATVSRVLGKVLKGAAITGTGLLTKVSLGDASLGTEFAKAMLKEPDLNYLETVKSNHVEQVESIKKVRHELENLAEVIKKNHGASLPVVVLVDELDRCRPNYAIEMLEVIKHFFTTKYFVFVVATDSVQLQHSIKAVYGSEFDSRIYLKRFFDREARLTKPDLGYYLRLLNLEPSYKQKGLVLYPTLINYVSDGLNDYIRWVAEGYNLELRDVDQLVAKLKACLRYAHEEYLSTSNKQYINLFSLIVSLAEFDMKVYESSDNKTSSYSELRQSQARMRVGSPPTHGTSTHTNLRDFIALMKHCSKMHQVQSKPEYGRPKKINAYGTHSNFRNLASGDLGESAFEEVASIVSCYVQESKTSNPRFWLWGDYAKITQLAGALE